MSRCLEISNLDTTKPRFSPCDSTVSLSERADQLTIRKAQGLPITPPLNFESSPSLEGRVEKFAPSLDPRHFENIEKSLKENPLPANYLVEVQNLVGLILAQLNRIGEKDRHQMEELKTQYKRCTAESASLQRELGSHNWHFALISFAASFLQFASPHQADREIANIIARECCPKLGDWYGSGINANMNQTTARGSLTLAEYQAKSNKGSSDSGNKQELIDILNKILQSLRDAARAG